MARLPIRITGPDPAGVVGPDGPLMSWCGRLYGPRQMLCMVREFTRALIDGKGIGPVVHAAVATLAEAGDVGLRPMVEAARMRRLLVREIKHEYQLVTGSSAGYARFIRALEEDLPLVVVCSRRVGGATLETNLPSLERSLDWMRGDGRIDVIWPKSGRRTSNLSVREAGSYL